MSFFFNSDTLPPDDSEPVSSRVTRLIATTRAPPPRGQTPPAPSFYKREIADLTSQLETALRVIDELKGHEMLALEPHGPQLHALSTI
ncbi:hypothetical protein HDU87_007457 [Geranomyces variabilis]|uniref:Uncharacterized protein n=1 Tax=Geranomyces variabilis TaxID=109894 RepID=A0AAD5XSU0_9FUNG|nr:hypothetical protein HDU87_007457 [Geranomyces variabilis]